MSGAESAKDGAALTREDDVVLADPGFLRFNAEGTNAVASFFKSRSSGSANTVAAVSFASAVGPKGLGGGREDNWLTRWAW